MPEDGIHGAHEKNVGHDCCQQIDSQWEEDDREKLELSLDIDDGNGVNCQ